MPVEPPPSASVADPTPAGRIAESVPEPVPAPLPAEAGRVLYRREAGGLRLALLARMIAYAVLLGVSLTVGASAAVLGLAGALVVLGGGLTAFSLLWIDRDRDLTVVGFAGLAFDCLFLALLPVVWFWSAAGAGASTAFLAGIPFGELAILVLAVNTLPLRPAYPLIGTAVIFLVGLVLHVVLVTDPQTVFVNNPAEAFREGAVDLRTAALGLAQVVAAGLLLTWLASAARQAAADAANTAVTVSHLRRFFAPATVGRFLAGRDRTTAQPRLHEAAVLFCRLQDFQRLSDTLPPETLVAWLADHRRRMVDLVVSFGGTVNEVSGDTVLASFGLPGPLTDAPLRAVRCGVAMKRALSQWNGERADRGEPQLRQGMGVHHGRVVAGFVGEGALSDYTVLGETVDVAVRLGQACEELGEVFLVTGTVADWVANAVPLRHLTGIVVEGRRAPADVFAVDFGRPPGTRPSRRTSLMGTTPDDDGPVRDILAGRKTTMCCPLAFWDTPEDPATIPGDRVDVYDGQGRYRCTVQVTEVAQVRFGAPDARTIRGEQCRDLKDFQARHAESWATDLAAMGQPLDDDTVIVVEHFMLAEVEAPKRS